MKNKKLNKLSIVIMAILIACGKEQEFEFPLVFTGDVINITDTSAVFSAKISCLGDYPIIESGFIWGVDSYDNNKIKIINEEKNTDMYSLKTNVRLFPGKTYYVRAYVQTESVISYGRDVSFKSTEGQIETGKWSQIYNAHFSSRFCKSVRSSFVITMVR